MMRVGAVGVGLALYPVGAVVGISVIASGAFYFMAADSLLAGYRASHVAARVARPDGSRLILRNYQVREAKLLTAVGSESWGLGFNPAGRSRVHALLRGGGKEAPPVEVRGEDALSLAAKILPWINRDGGTEAELTDALRVLGKETDPIRVFERASRMSKRSNWSAFENRGTIANLPTQVRLALEIISHEHFERTVLEGELPGLEAAWREAEEIAAIADDLFLPSSVLKRFAELRGER